MSAQKKIIHRILCSVGLSVFLLTLNMGVLAEELSQDNTPILSDRLAGQNRYETAAAISQSGWTTSDYAVIASGEKFPDALCGAPLARKYEAPILLTGKEALNKATKSQLAALQVKNVYLIGGEGVISAKVEQDIKDMGIRVERIAGGNRYETSLQVAKIIGECEQAILSTGENFPDALAMAPIAAHKGMPILLTPQDSLSDQLLDYIRANVAKTYVLGGTGVISDRVLQQLPSPQRLSGSNRYETNIRILQEFAGELNFATCYLAQGGNFPDALAGSALAAITGSPVILVQDPPTESSKAFIKSKTGILKKVIAFGGTGAVPERIVDGIRNNFENSEENIVGGAPGVICPIAAGDSYSMFIKSDGSLWACGSNFKGALGDGTTEDRPVPVKVMNDVTAVSASYYFTLVIKKDGGLWGWGNNQYGQLGDRTRIDKIVPLKIMDGVQAVSAMMDHNFAVKKDGSVWAWGSNPNGELGDGTTTDRLRPVKIMDNVVQVTSGASHALALKKDGSLWGWGVNLGGELGIGFESKKVLTPLKIMEDVSAVSAGAYTTMAVKKDGSLWGWGSNKRGSVGDGTNGTYLLGEGMGSTWYVSYPQKIMEDVRTLAVGGSSGTTMAIKKDGSLWAWGANEYGQVGDGTTETRYSPVKIMDDAVAAAVGIEHAMVVKKDGSLWSWGSNENGRIGDGTATVYDAWHESITEDNERHRPVRVTEGIMLP